MSEKRQGLAKNLDDQITKIYNRSHQHSTKTRDTYKDILGPFCNHVAEKFNLQKLENIKPKHIYSYVEDMRERGLAKSTMQKFASTMRDFSKLKRLEKDIPSNEKLGISGRPSYNECLDRAWTQNEYKKAVSLAQDMERRDVEIVLKLEKNLGLRISEVFQLKNNQLTKALEMGELSLLQGQAKNGKPRDIPVVLREQRAALHDAIIYAKSIGNRKAEKAFVDATRGSVSKGIRSQQDWVGNHRSKFQEPDRDKDLKFEKEAKELDYRVKTDAVTNHGLRYTNSQELLKYYTEKGDSEKIAYKKISRALGHERAEVTALYCRNCS